MHFSQSKRNQRFLPGDYYQCMRAIIARIYMSRALILMEGLHSIIQPSRTQHSAMTALALQQHQPMLF